MDTNSQHKDILFLVSLSPEIIIDLEKKNIDYSYFLNKIRSFANVDFRESISKENLAIANHYKIVIVIGHRKGESLELSDRSLFPMADIVTSLPFDFSGVIDVSVCNSTVIHDAIKKHCPNALVQTANEKTGIDFRLPLYFILLNHLPANINYRDAYILLLKRMEAKQSLIPKQELENRPTTTKLGDTSAYMPKSIIYERKYPFHVFIHDGDDEDEMEERETIVKNTSAKPVNLEDDVKEISLWIIDLAQNDEVVVDLHFDTDLMEIEDDEPQKFIWKGHQIHAVFLAKLKSDFVNDTLWCTINVFVNGLPTKKLKVEIGIDNFRYPHQSGLNSIPRAGRPIKPLFKDNDEKDKRKAEFLSFLEQCYPSSVYEIETRKSNIVSMAFWSFYKIWADKGIVEKTANGRACFRFLTGDCHIKSTVKEKAYGDFIRDTIDDFIRGKISKNIDDQVLKWFSSYGLNNKA